MESLKRKDEGVESSSSTTGEHTIFNSIELRGFEEKSFENMIYFYRDELLQVMKGKNATELFSTYTRRSFLMKGITRMRGSNTFLTERARNILEKFSIEHTEPPVRERVKKDE